MQKKISSSAETILLFSSVLFCCCAKKKGRDEKTHKLGERDERRMMVYNQNRNGVRPDIGEERRHLRGIQSGTQRVERGEKKKASVRLVDGKEGPPRNPKKKRTKHISKPKRAGYSQDKSSEIMRSGEPAQC